MLKKGIYVLFLVLAQIAFAQERDLCIDQPPEESNPEGHAPQHHFTMYFNPKMNTNVAPLWKRLCDIYKSPDYHLSMIKIDCTSCIITCILQSIIHYPTFMFFQAGESEGITFNGEVDITSLTAFIDEQLKKAETAGDE